MKINIIILLFFPLFLNAREYNLNSIEETLLVFRNDVSATNCSPSKLGYISEVQKESHLLKFTPNGLKGVVVCSAHLKDIGVIKFQFNLYKGLKNPMIEISYGQSLKKSPLTEFESFISGDRSLFIHIPARARFVTKAFSYQLVSKYHSSSSMYFYQFLVRPMHRKSGAFIVKNDDLSPILYSYFNKKESQLYLMTSRVLSSHHFKRHFR